MTLTSITPLAKKNLEISAIDLAETTLKTAVILVNSGTPVQPTYSDVRSFLKELLSDPRIVELPRPLWLFILNVFILPIRTPKMTKAYKKIWGDKHSPLRSISHDQAKKLQQQLTEHFPDNPPRVAYAMNYSGPKLDEVITALEREGIHNFVVLPLYPQYSACVTGTTYDAVADIIRTRRNIPQVHVIKQYYHHQKYIEALAARVESYWQTHGRPEKLLLSFHSIPKAYVEAGDPYYYQCKKTTEMLVEKLGLEEHEWELSFQSRFLGGKWLAPYTSVTLDRLGQENLKRVDVFCPAFAADCLETLEEIDVENRERFIRAGGEEYHMIPCLNDDELHIEMMRDVVKQYLPNHD